MSGHALDAAALATDRRVYIIDDLLGAILLLAAAALAVLLDLTRRQICAVYQLAFALCGACAFFILGGLIDHHLSNEQLHMALYGSYLSNSLTTSYVYLPTLASIGVSLALLFSLSTCTCDCCCLVGTSSTAHAKCFSARIRANLSLYGACLVALYVAIGTRLNVRLRESAINPVGGTLHWTLLRTPFYLAMAHIGSLLLVALKLFLQHADRSSMHHTTFTMSAAAAERQTSGPQPATTVEDLMRPPPVKNFALAPPRRTSSESTKHALPRSPQPTASLTAKSELRTASPRSTMGAKPSTAAVARRPSDNNRAESQHDGDVSSLISSDSDSDDGVLRPSFRSTSMSSSSSTAKPPRHGPSAVRKRQSGGSAVSGYSSSPPPSPTHSTGSSSSAAFARARSGASGPRPGSSSSSSSSSRPRLTSSGSSSSTTFLSDTDDHLLSNLEAYGSSGNESAYASDQRPLGGIRRRAPSLGTSVNSTARRPSVAATAVSSTASQKLYQEPSQDWMECLDEATGSAYYYNTRTGESRWKDH